VTWHFHANGLSKGLRAPSHSTARFAIRFSVGRFLTDEQATAVVVERPVELLPSDPDRKAVMLGWGPVG
jgi:hypothetical protein